MNFFRKVLLEKEGEVIIERQSLKLRGKGAHDQGESIYFHDIKELTEEDGSRLHFTTYKKEKYTLSGFSNLFTSFLKDFFRVRNEYFAEHLFMKVGMLYKEYDASVEVITKQDDLVPKGKCRIQFYEGSLLVIPESSECFVLYYNFLKSHEFDEDEYVLRFYMDNGTNVMISKLGSSFDEARESFELLLGKLYQKIVNQLMEVLPGVKPTELLKLAYAVRDNKAVSMHALKKMHEDLPGKVEELALGQNTALRAKIQALRKLEPADQHFYIGLSFLLKPDKRDIQVKGWFCLVMPQKNTIALGITTQPNDATLHFFRISLDLAQSEEKLPEKMYEIQHSMYILKGDLGPLYKEKKELQKGRFRIALRRLSPLRFLRKSYIWRNFGPDIQYLERDLDTVFKRAALSMKVHTFSKTKGVVNRPT